MVERDDNTFLEKKLTNEGPYLHPFSIKLRFSYQVLGLQNILSRTHLIKPTSKIISKHHLHHHVPYYYYNARIEDKVLISKRDNSSNCFTSS